MTTVLWPLSHLSWLPAVLYQLSPSTTIHSILPVQLMCLTVFLHNLSPSHLWSASWTGTLHFILQTFLHPIIVFFSSTYVHTVATCYAVVPWLCHLFLVFLSAFYLELYCLHIYLTILISARWSTTSFSFLAAQVSFPCNILLCTQLLYSLPLILLILLPFYGSLSRTTQVSRYQKKHSPTHTCHGHQSSFICFLPSITIHGFLPVQFTCMAVFSTISLQVFFGLPLGLAPSTSYSVHSSPNHCLLFGAHAHTALQPVLL